MSENKTQNGDQESGGKSHQEQTQDGKKKREIDPNNPTADRDNKEDYQEIDEQNEGSVNTDEDSDDQEVEEE